MKTKNKIYAGASISLVGTASSSFGVFSTLAHPNDMVGVPTLYFLLGIGVLFTGLFLIKQALQEWHVLQTDQEEKQNRQTQELSLLLEKVDTGKTLLDREARLRGVVSCELQKEKEVAQSYLETANMIMTALDRDGNIEMINRKGLELIGKTEYDLVGELFSAVAVAPKDQARVHQEFIKVLTNEKELAPQMEYSVLSDRGERRILWANALICDNEGQAQGLLLCGEDVSERREQEERLKLMKRMLESIDEGVVAIDSRNRIIWANPSCERITGYSAAGLMNKPLDFLYPTPAGISQLKHALKEVGMKGYWRGEVAARQLKGLSYPQKLSLAPVRGDSGSGDYTVAVFSDVTAEKSRENHISYLANHDTLTGLPNRASFTRKLDAAIENAKKDPNEKVAVMFIDLDHFKKVNDTLGHAVGDKLLVEVGNRLRDCLRHGDFISRLGGDEFTIIIEKIRTAKDAELSAKKILQALSRPYEAIGEHGIKVTPSIGICMYPDDGNDTPSLIKRSDQAMYQAKNEGRGTLRFYSPEINNQDIEHLMLENRLRRALESRSIQQFYQPKVNFKTGQLTGFEALARWNDPLSGQMSPSIFIPIAEETGLIVELGLLALRDACSQLALWQMEGLMDLEMAVNLSPIQFREHNLKTELKKILDETGINPKLLQLELTETAITNDLSGGQTILLDLKELGVSLAIDDFGTGHSSLARLKDLPVDVLKIDKSFVDGVPGNPSAEAICKVVIALGQSMGMKVVAEGVESKEQARFLIDSGAHEAQGYLYSKALSAVDMGLLIKKNKGFFDVGLTKS